MAIDVSKFHQTFFDESFEGLDQMEAGLLDLEVGADNGEAINTIFRAAHSIKGGAATLGFHAVADFTHLVETILDRSRAGDHEIDDETVDVLLASVDRLRDMLEAARDGADLDVESIAEVERRLQRLLDVDAPTAADPAPPVGPGEGAETAVTEWRIRFEPHADIYRSGNDPLRILAELAELAEPDTYRVEVDRRALPDLEHLDVETSYLTWTVEMAATVDEAAIEQVFEWVEDEADIVIERIVADAATTADAAAPDATDLSATDLGAGPGVGPEDLDAPTRDTGSATPAVRAAEPAPERRSGDDRRSAGDRRQADKSSSAQTSIRVDIEKIDTLINMVGELVITQSMLQQLADGTDDVDLDKLREGLAELERNTRELQGSVMQIRMLPISFAFSRLPRLVRDIASKLGKSVDLQIRGETTELDKTVMEKIGDPLVHLVRNALDHGIESPEVRVAAGKPETGTVTLDAYHEGGNIVIEITDDGGGISTGRIAAKARERGLIGEDDQLNDRQVHDLIFHPGFSTAETVSDISGRGVGMDVVRRNITDLGGVIEVDSTEGRGSTFRIRLPLTLAILDGQVVRVADEVFIIPLVSIVESLQYDPTRTSTLVEGASVYRHRGATIPVVRLDAAFGIAPGEPSATPLLVVVEADGTRAGILVDDLLAQQQIVIKSLKSNFRAVPGLSGATILGDGTVALILDVNSVLALHRQAVPGAGRAA